MYFKRKAYTFLSLSYIIGVLKNKVSTQRGSKKIVYVFSAGNRFIRNIFDESRGYSTILMQLVRSLGIKRGYNKDIYDCTNEGIFIACMGLSRRATYITKENIDYYLQGIDNVELDSDIICDMVERMMDKPYGGNYLK